MRTAGTRDQGPGISTARRPAPWLAPEVRECEVEECKETSCGSGYCSRCEEEIEALFAMDRAKAARNERRRQQIAEGRGVRQRLLRWVERQEGLVLLVIVSCMLAGFFLETLPFWLSLVTGKDVSWTR